MSWRTEVLSAPVRYETEIMRDCWICGLELDYKGTIRRRKACKPCLAANTKQYIDERIKRRMEFLREQREARAMPIPPCDERWIIGSPYRDPITHKLLAHS